MILRLLVIALATVSLSAESKITLLHFSDYHSHALPFYTDEGDRGGIARAIRYLRQAKRRGAFVFSGGDMINKGAPAWSDAYRCAEWPWLNGIVDAMAFGNHDADYGMETFELCRNKLRYPVLSANTTGFSPYVVLERDSVRIGVFAIAGKDFPQLVKTPGLTFTDPVDAAREVVATLRSKERVHAVVMIGHQHADDDYALAKAVPGIDLIFGSHSHLRRELVRIPDTNTWFISPSQYLTYISRVELTFRDSTVAGVTGRLVPVDAEMPEDRTIARFVRQMQSSLEGEESYRDLFATIGRIDSPLSTAAVAELTLRLMREATSSDAALSTRSSFRRPLPAGPITMELLRGAMPYDNELVTCEMTGAQLQKVLDFSGSRAGSDSGSYVSVAIPLEPARTYKVATTDYQANVAYRDVFTCEKQKTGTRVRDLVRRKLAGIASP